MKKIIFSVISIVLALTASCSKDEVEPKVDKLQVALDTAVPGSFYRSLDGEATVSVMGGVPPYVLTWEAHRERFEHTGSELTVIGVPTGIDVSVTVVDSLHNAAFVEFVVPCPSIKESLVGEKWEILMGDVSWMYFEEWKFEDDWSFSATDRDSTYSYAGTFSTDDDDRRLTITTDSVSYENCEVLFISKDTVNILMGPNGRIACRKK